MQTVIKWDNLKAQQEAEEAMRGGTASSNSIPPRSCVAFTEPKMSIVSNIPDFTLL